jgi:hypothetical protein
MVYEEVSHDYQVLAFCSGFSSSLNNLFYFHNIIIIPATFEDAFEILKGLAEESGAPSGIELLRIRLSENTILVGLPGMKEEIEKGTFPPPPRPRNPPPEQAPEEE